MATNASAAEAKKAGAKKKATKGKRESKPRAEEPTETNETETIAEESTSLSEEALKVMGSQSAKIAEQLLEQTIKGQKKGAQMLSKLAKKEAEAKEALDHGPLRSQALAWAAEPQWQDEAEDENAETGSGSREAE
jgi:hypothetical protein